MNIMLVGGISSMMRALSFKLYKEGHRLFVLSGSRDPGKHYRHIFERYDIPYDSPSVEEVFRSVRPDVTILLGAFDGNYPSQDPKREAVGFSAGLQNILLSWAASGQGRLVYLSSAEVFGSSYPTPISEQTRPSPRGIRPLMLYQGEESCRFYLEQLGRDVLVLRLDPLHDVPTNLEETQDTLCGRMCLEAFQDSLVRYRSNFRYGLTYLGDAVESINKLVACPRHNHWLYHISSARGFSELEIAQTMQSVLGDGLKSMDNTLEEGYSVVLSNERLKQEFGFSSWREPEDTIRETLQHMRRHSFRFLSPEHPGMNPWQRLYYQGMKMLGALVPYLETLAFFIPFFMLNNRATDSQYFSKIDFYLLYVLLLAMVHGQRQATFAAALATAGYMFRQMYGRTGLAVVADYNTYVWIAEIFILGLTVGYMKDTVRFLREEKEQEVDFLTERVADIGDINDSNLRVKEGLMNQVIDYDHSLGTVYEATEKLTQDQPVEIVFHAVTTIQKLMNCRDVAIYRISPRRDATMVAYSSRSAASMGKRFFLSERKSLEDAFSRNEVYVNRTMEKGYPMMAYNISPEDSMQFAVLIWDIPFERLTIAEANRLTVIAQLIKLSIRRADRYLQSLTEGVEQDKVNILDEDSFEKMLTAYQNAGKARQTEYVLLRLPCVHAEQEEKSRQLHRLLRKTDYIGNRSDGKLYALLSCTNHREGLIVQNRLAGLGFSSEIMEESEL